MKRTYLRHCGKRGRINIEQNKNIKEKFMIAGINKCELCESDFALSFHHKHHRWYYYKNPEGLSDMNEVILLCAECHPKFSPDSEKTINLFKQLRK